MNARRLAKHAAIAATLLCAVGRADAAPMVAAPFVTVGVGDTFSVPITVAGAVDLTSWQFDMAFDPNIVRADSISDGPFLAAFGTTLTPPTVFSPGVIDNTTGLVSLVTEAFVDLPPFPSGDGVLAIIQFSALAAGVSPLTFENIFLNDFTDGFAAANGQIIVGSGSTVPEPATLLLVASGLAVGGRRRLKRQLASVVGLIAIMIGAAAAPVGAQTIGAGPYYAVPAWDQQLACSINTNCPRFVVLSNWNNQAVLDRETGLVWEQSPSSSMFPWTRDIADISTLSAAEHCANLRIGSRQGWRLPSIQELSSLLDPSQQIPGPFLPPGHPFGNVVNMGRVLTATITASAPDTVWFVNFIGGGVGGFGPKNEPDRVWCVRGGSGPDAQ